MRICSPCSISSSSRFKSRSPPSQHIMLHLHFEHFVTFAMLCYFLRTGWPRKPHRPQGLLGRKLSGRFSWQQPQGARPLSQAMSSFPRQPLRPSTWYPRVRWHAHMHHRTVSEKCASDCGSTNLECCPARYLSWEKRLLRVASACRGLRLRHRASALGNYDARNCACAC